MADGGEDRTAGATQRNATQRDREVRPGKFTAFYTLHIGYGRRADRQRQHERLNHSHIILSVKMTSPSEFTVPRMKDSCSPHRKPKPKPGSTQEAANQGVGNAQLVSMRWLVDGMSPYIKQRSTRTYSACL